MTIARENIWHEIINRYLVSDPNVSELTAQGGSSIFLRRSGKRMEVKNVFSSPEEYSASIIELVKMFNPNPPEKMEFLEEGRILFNNGGLARCHVVLPPACDYPQVSIARKTTQITSLDAIQASGSINSIMRRFIEAAVGAKLNIIFSGGTGSGKSLGGDVLIPTSKGFVKMRDIKIGDVVFDRNGKATKVINKYKVEDEALMAELDDGTMIPSGAGHLWVTSTYGDYEIVQTTDEIGAKIRLSKEIYLPITKPVELNNRDTDKEYYKYGEKYLINSKSLDKNIINNVMYAPLPSRWKFVKGFLDNIVKHDKGLVTVIRPYTVFLNLHSDIPINLIINVLCSLGVKCTKSIDHTNGNSRIELYTPKNPFSRSNMTLHGEFVRRSNRDEFNPHCIGVKSISKIYDDIDLYCIAVDSPTKTFLCTEHFIVTHNTTFMEAVGKLIPKTTRIGVAEDSPELAFTQPNTTYLHSTVWKPGMDLNNVAPLQWCVQQFNRMRLDTCVVGEVRGKEFFDWMVAANSGLDGSMCTLHADTPSRALEKMSQFVIMAHNQPTRTANQAIANTVDIIIQLSKFPDGRYRCTEIAEVSKILSNDETSTIAITPLFSFDPVKDEWSTEAPRLSDQLRERFERFGYDSRTFTKREHSDMVAPQRPNRLADRLRS